MRIGVCSEPSEWAVVFKCGYDFCEGNFSSLAECMENKFADIVKLQQASGLSVEVFNGFFPNDMNLYETGFNKLKNYVECGFYRASALGGKLAVIGSSKSRRVPDNMDKSDALQYFSEVLTLCGDIAQNYGMKIVIEPLNVYEDNLINTVDDALKLCCDLNNPNIGMLIDFYHFYRNGENIDNLAYFSELSRYLLHLHLARPNNDRGLPTINDMKDMRPWADALQKIGYSGRLSLEGCINSSFETAIQNAYAAVEDFRVLK